LDEIQVRKYNGHTAIESETYAIPLPVQTSETPNGLPFSLQTARTITRSMLSRFPVHINTYHKLEFKNKRSKYNESMEHWFLILTHWDKYSSAAAIIVEPGFSFIYLGSQSDPFVGVCIYSH